MHITTRVAAETVGTAVLVIGGVGTAVLAPDVGPLGIALAFGVTLLVLVYVVGPISGAHLNPAVTLAMLLRGRIAAAHAGLYVVGQAVGGVLGAGIVLAVANSRDGYSLAADGLGANGWGAASSGGYQLAGVLVVEVVLTALLAYTVLTVAGNSELTVVAALPIGAVLALCHLIAIPIDGTSVNPARSLGSAVFAGGPALTQLWAFVLAPLVGGAIAAAVHHSISRAGDSARETVRNSR